MPSEIFKASRWTKGNLFFPTYIEVSDKAVTRRKRSWFSRDEISMSISKVASVHIKTGMIWSEIRWLETPVAHCDTDRACTDTRKNRADHNG